MEDAPTRPLPLEVPESSGVAVSRADPDVLWTHNDSGWDAELFAVGRDGSLLGRVPVEGARNRDWEDLAVGPCEAGSCLYVADTGDNLLERSELAVYRVPEPDPGAAAATGAERFPLTLPDGPRDIEAVFLLPGEELFLVSKGRGGPVEVYRYPPPLRADRAVEVERVQRLTDRRPLLPDMVTGAAATPDGSLVAVRTYQTLRFYRPVAGDGAGESRTALEPVSGGVVNLRPLRERQGEAVAFDAGGRIVLTSEAGPGRSVGSLNVLRCRLPGYEW